MCNKTQANLLNVKDEQSISVSRKSAYDGIDCVMPAAGMSSRMGLWKMMLTYRQHTILDESIENALGFCSRVILVTGYRGDELEKRYANDKRITLVHNKDFRLGIFSSMQLGSRFVKSEHYFICHGDMPCVTKDIYQTMWQYRGEQVVFPGSERKWGHPALIPQDVISKISVESPTANMKPILKAHGIHFLNMTTNGIHFDVDTPEEYNKLLCSKCG